MLRVQFDPLDSRDPTIGPFLVSWFHLNLPLRQVKLLTEQDELVVFELPTSAYAIHSASPVVVAPVVVGDVRSPAI